MLIEIFRQGQMRPKSSTCWSVKKAQMSYVTDRPRKAHLRIVVHTPQKHINTNGASGLLSHHSFLWRMHGALHRF